MNEEPRSPKRRHILSSINPSADQDPDTEPRRKRRRRSRSRSRSRDDSHRKERSSRRKDKQDENDEERRRERRRRREERDARHDGNEEDKTRPRRSKLKLKHGHRPHRRRYRSHSRHEEDSESMHTTGRRHRHGEEQQRSRSPTPPNPHAFDPLDSETAFRESIFDAMADDEGAEYWESVYGQPVHIYDQPTSGQGELERMTDEEYAAYVRQKMWEKTNAGLLEERAKREERKKKREEEDKRKRRLEKEMEESLRRGEERRARRKVRDRWETYEKGWRDWDGKPEAIFWPGVEKGAEVDATTVRAFFVHGLQLEDVGEKTFTSRLKDERVRWHPDKIQQRAGGTVDEATMRNVTAVFQIIDRLWGEMRDKA